MSSGQFSSSPRGSCLLARFVALLMGMLLCSSTHAQGFTNFVTRGGRGQDVLQVQTVFATPDSEVFGNMRVTIRCLKGVSKADRNLTAVFYVRSYASQEQHFAYYASMVLAEGQAQVVLDIPHTAIEGQALWDVTLLEDGRDIEDDRNRNPNQMDFQWNGGQATNPLGTIAFLVEDDAKVDASNELAKLFPESAGLSVAAANPSLNGTPTPTQAIPYAIVIPVRDAESDWRKYLGFRVCAISLSTIENLCESYPEAAEALRKYVASGGKLLILDAKGESGWAAIKRLLRFDEQADLEQRSTAIRIPKKPWWKSQQFADVMGQKTVRRNKNGMQPKEDLDAAYPLRLDGIAYDAFVLGETWSKWSWGNHLDNLGDLSEFLETDVLYPSWYDRLRYELLASLETESIYEFDYLNGRVWVAQKPLDALPANLRSHLAEQTVAYAGGVAVASGQDGNWFWRNFITQVGKPPVWVFCGLVAVFGGLLGPGLLLVTGRMKRRSLMIFLVPALSLLATTSIILYGVLHEGFDTYVRVTSIQAIDPDSKNGFVWSRQNYFSGLPPREGLTFEAEAYVRPVAALDEANNRYANPRQGVSTRIFLGENQQWQGWLKSRQQQQLMVGHPVHDAEMPIAVRKLDSGKILLENLTDVLLPLVVLRGQGEDYYFAESLLAHGAVEIEPIDGPRLGVQVARAFAPLRPETPEELMSRSASGFRSGRGLGRANSASSDLINKTIERYFSELQSIPRNGFAVIRSESDQVQVPIAGNDSDSIHIVFGVKKW